MDGTGQSAADKRFSNSELTVSTLASRRARRQLLRVRWDLFSKAYEEYPRLQGLSLWSRAIVSQEGEPSELLNTLREHCPEFVQTAAFVRKPNLIGFRFLEWVHSNKLAYARQQGWLDALTFYGVRHLCSRAVWAYWEQCVSEPCAFSSNRFLNFDEWWQRAMEMKLAGSVSYHEIAPILEEYIELEARAKWLRLLATANIKITTDVLSQLERIVSETRQSSHARSGKEGHKKSSNWLSIIHAGKRRCLREARRAGCLDLFKELLRSHPRPIRLRAYLRHCKESGLQNWLQQCPPFEQWLFAADQYIRE